MAQESSINDREFDLLKKTTNNTASVANSCESQSSSLISIYNDGVKIADGANLDSFSRLRTSNPQGVFDAQFTYDLAPLQYETITSNGGGGVATIAHDPTNRCALMTFTVALTGAKAFMQSYEYVRYQPGRSQVVFVTFNFIESSANTMKFAGISDWSSVSAGLGNGIEFQLNGSTKQWTIYSDSDNGDETVAQANWNLDKLDGTGASGISLDITKTQIAVIDFQALYVGRVRVGFDIGGSIIYCHEFNHANLANVPYVQNASLPIKCGMTSSGTVTTTMRFICSAVISEGGQEDISGISCCAIGSVTASNGADTHILSIRPKTTFNSITNRTKFVPESVDLIVTGSSPIIWKMVIGQAISGTTTFNDANASYSAFEYNTAGTISGSAALILQRGFVASSTQTKGASSPRITYKIPITLSADGLHRANGTLSIIVNGIGGTSACQAVINWKELR